MIQEVWSYQNLCVYLQSKRNRVVSKHMPPKYRKSTTKKKIERRKKQFFVSLKNRRQSSPLSTFGFFSFRRPLFITTTTRGLTKEQRDLLKKLEAKGLLPKITWIESDYNSFDDKMKMVLLYLHTDEAKMLGCKIQKQYDYAWIKIALERGQLPDYYTKYRYMSTPKFVEYIKSLGFTDIAGSKTINKAIAQAEWHSEGNSLSFPRHFIDNLECKRRNNIVSKFLEMMNEV